MFMTVKNNKITAQKTTWESSIQLLNLEIQYRKKKEKNFSFYKMYETKATEVKDLHGHASICSKKTIIERYLKGKSPHAPTENKINFLRTAMKVFGFDLIDLDILVRYYDKFHENQCADTEIIKKGETTCSEKNLEIYVKNIREPALEQAEMAHKMFGTEKQYMEISKLIVASSETKEKELKKLLFKEFKTDDIKKEIFQIYKIYSNLSEPVKFFFAEIWLTYKLKSYREIEIIVNKLLKDIWGIESEKINFEKLTFDDITGDFRNLLLLKEQHINNGDVPNKDKMKFKEFSEKSEKINAMDLYVVHKIYLLRNMEDKEGLNKMVNLMLRFFLLTKQN